MAVMLDSYLNTEDLLNDNYCFLKVKVKVLILRG